MSDDNQKVDFHEFYKNQKARRQQVFPNRAKRNFTERPETRIPSWAMRLRYFKADEAPTRIRLIPQESGQLWHTYFGQWLTVGDRKRFILSNSHNGILEVPDLLYFYAYEDQNRMLFARKTYVVTVLVLEDFYKVPKTSKNGGTYYEYKRSYGTDQFGRSLDPAELADAGHEKVFGRQLHLSLRDGDQYEHFMEQLSAVSERCGNCKEGAISVYAYNCGECGEEIANHKTNPIRPDLERQLRNEQVACQACDHQGKATQVTECVSKRGYGSATSYVAGCDNPTMIDPSECDLVVRGGPASKGTLIDIVDFVPSDNDDERIKDWMARPMAFKEFFSYMDLEEQARTLARPNVFDASAQTILERHFQDDPSEPDTHSVPYGTESDTKGLSDDKVPF